MRNSQLGMKRQNPREGEKEDGSTEHVCISFSLRHLELAERSCRLPPNAPGTAIVAYGLHRQDPSTEVGMTNGRRRTEQRKEQSTQLSQCPLYFFLLLQLRTANSEFIIVMLSCCRFHFIAMTNTRLATQDPEIFALIQKETGRQQEGLEMIPSENHTSGAVLEALGSRLTDKYSEGYPGMRYYGGCQFVDQIEDLARERAKKLFGSSHANVQPYSGSPANLAVYFALLNAGETAMGLKLTHGGHMTHGLKVNFSGTLYNNVQYGVKADGYIDIDSMRALAREHKPKLIVVGATAYPRQYDWAIFQEIAAEVDAFLLADISHIAGLVVGGVHPSPVGIADVVTTTTHKTLRGPRGAIILCNGKASEPLKSVERTKENLPSLIDRAIIPGLQGGPHNHQTAAIAVALQEAMQPEFKEYASQIVRNAKTLADALLSKGYNLVTGGTDNHLLVADLTNKNISGKQAEVALGKAGITVNKNTVPFEPRTPFDPSGIRMGTPALTTRGLKEGEMQKVASFIDQAIMFANDDVKLALLHEEVKELCTHFPLPA